MSLSLGTVPGVYAAVNAGHGHHTGRVNVSRRFCVRSLSIAWMRSRSCAAAFLLLCIVGLPRRQVLGGELYLLEQRIDRRLSLVARGIEQIGQASFDRIEHLVALGCATMREPQHRRRLTDAKQHPVLDRVQPEITREPDRTDAGIVLEHVAAKLLRLLHPFLVAAHCRACEERTSGGGEHGARPVRWRLGTYPVHRTHGSDDERLGSCEVVAAYPAQVLLDCIVQAPASNDAKVRTVAVAMHEPGDRKAARIARQRENTLGDVCAAKRLAERDHV
jgi:hypothetical protein